MLDMVTRSIVIAGLFAFVASVVATTGEKPTYTRIPFGRSVLSHCLHEVPSGSHSYAQPDGSTKVLGPDGEIHRIIPKCESQHPTFRFHGEEERLPADYDGWLSYTSLNVTDVGRTGGFDSFTSTMSVPDEPKEPAQILYFFPGLQNIDWIPKVDPEPTESEPFDIIQPVLQYPYGLFRKGWGLKSWYVTVNAGALYSSGVSVEAGDAILCNMTRTGDASWSISGTLKSDPSKVQEQSATNAKRLKVQPWAYSAVTECYGCHGCDTFPTKPITFTDNKLYQAGELVPVKGSDWHVNAKPPVKFECHEKTTVASNGDATTTFV